MNSVAARAVQLLGPTSVPDLGRDRCAGHTFAANFLSESASESGIEQIVW